MFLKRSLPLVLFLICLSVCIGCKGDETDEPAEGEGAGAQGAPVDQQVADKPGENNQHEVMKPAANSLDLTYITDDFTSAVIVHPARVLNSEFMGELVKAGLPLEEALQEPIDKLGIDPRNVKQIILLTDKATAEAAPLLLPVPMGPPGGQPGGFGPTQPLEGTPENPDQSSLTRQHEKLQTVAFQPEDAIADTDAAAEEPTPTLIVRFSNAIDEETFFNGLPGPPLETGEVDGLKVRKVKNPDAVLHFANPQTLIVTRATLLKKMVETKSAESGLITELKNIDATHDLIVVADLTPVRQLMQMGGEIAAAKLPPDLAALANIPNKTKMLTLTAGVSNASLLSATFVMDTADDAQATNTALTNGLKQVQAVYDQKKTQGLPPNVPLDEAGQQEVIAMADEIIAGLSNEANGNRLTISIPKPGNFNKLAELMGPMLKEAAEEAQKAAERTKQFNKLMEIGIAFHNYHDLYTAFPGAGSDADGKRKGLSWRVHLLPYLDQFELYEQFNMDEPWDSEHNKALISQMPDVYKTPGVTEEGKTAFHVVVGENAAFQMDKGRKISEFRDGTSNTILAVQAGPDTADIWTKPGGLEFNEADPFATFGNVNEGFQKLLILLTDASVREFSGQPGTLKALITPNGGETVNLNDF